MKKRFHRELRERGVYLSPDHMDFIMAAHTEGDIDATLSACADSLRVAKSIA
jgi:glutamate-1-semialdehyde aminotransferase